MERIAHLVGVVDVNIIPIVVVTPRSRLVVVVATNLGVSEAQLAVEVESCSHGLQEGSDFQQSCGAPPRIVTGRSHAVALPGHFRSNENAPEIKTSARRASSTLFLAQAGPRARGGRDLRHSSRISGGKRGGVTPTPALDLRIGEQGAGVLPFTRDRGRSQARAQRDGGKQVAHLVEADAVLA